MTPTPIQPGRRSQTLRLTADGATPRADARSPATSGWEVRREIARGGMGIVYLALDPALDRFLAIKRLAAAGTLGEAMRARFLREARAMAALNHIHICRVYAVGEDDAGPYIAMEYIAGPNPSGDPREPPAPFSLEALVARDGPLDIGKTMELTCKIAAAVEYAHRRGVIHRDLKPANVLLDEQSEPRVVDFGLAALPLTDDDRLTVTGDKLLSLGYGAPEQEQDAARADRRADVYALGGILYFCLTGENPRFYRDHLVPVHLRSPLLRALERDRERRWPSVEAFSDALAKAGEDRAAPVTEHGGWYCKWCHTLNTPHQRYCAGCRWDGLIVCPQCGQELRFGTRACSGCGADLRAFEDAEGLLELLRELRRRKQFEALLERSGQIDALRARRAVNEDTYRQIAELRQGAAWALRRKEELRQAISAETAAEDYERVRELLNEYDVIDNGDTYGDLRARLPEKIAARHIVKLRRRLQNTALLMQQKKISSSRAMMAALRDQEQWIAKLTESLALPRHAATDTNGAEPSPGDPAALLAFCRAAIERLDHELGAEEARIEAWQDEAEEAFHKQDYDHCIRLCREVELVTAEPTPAAELLVRATEASRATDRLSRTAQQALAARQWKEAEAAARALLDRWKANHAGARSILASLTRRKRMHGLRLAAALLLVAAGLYALALPPLMRVRGIQQRPEAASGFFVPAHRLYKTGPLRHYARWWGLSY